VWGRGCRGEPSNTRHTLMVAANEQRLLVNGEVAPGRKELTAGDVVTLLTATVKQSHTTAGGTCPASGACEQRPVLPHWHTYTREREGLTMVFISGVYGGVERLSQGAYRQEARVNAEAGDGSLQRVPPDLGGKATIEQHMAERGE
jgi:hypothetical protein